MSILNLNISESRPVINVCKVLYNIKYIFSFFPFSCHEPKTEPPRLRCQHVWQAWLLNSMCKYCGGTSDLIQILIPIVLLNYINKLHCLNLSLICYFRLYII